jgi:hypothetical protein
MKSDTRFDFGAYISFFFLIIVFLFAESGYFLLYPTPLGVKVVNMVTNKVARIIGRQETAERFLGIALYQGRTVGSAALGTLQPNAAPDPTLFACAWKRHRFYLFTTRLPSKDSEEGTGRDVFNEKPTKDELALNVASTIIITTMKTKMTALSSIPCCLLLCVTSLCLYV